MVARAVLLAVASLAYGCGSETFRAPDASADVPDADAAAAKLSDAGTPDANRRGDASPVDAGVECNKGITSDDHACTTDNDCVRVNVGCYCGDQPVVGVNRATEARTKACELARASNCGLGCAQTANFVADQPSHRRSHEDRRRVLPNIEQRDVQDVRQQLESRVTRRAGRCKGRCSVTLTLALSRRARREREGDRAAPLRLPFSLREEGLGDEGHVSSYARPR